MAAPIDKRISNLYPWETWFTSKAFTLKRGIHFTCTPDAMRQRVFKAAISHCVKVAMRVTIDSVIVLVSDIEPVHDAKHILIAVDPGAMGGVACFNDGKLLVAKRIPDNEEDLLRWFTNYTRSTNDDVVITTVVELVGGFIGRGEKGEEGNKGHPGSRMFNFGWSYGSVRMALLATTGILPTFVCPRVWQAKLGLAPRAKHKIGKNVVYTETQQDWKRRIKDLAAKKYPNVNVSLYNADAIMLGDYALNNLL